MSCWEKLKVESKSAYLSLAVTLLDALKVDRQVHLRPMRHHQERMQRRLKLSSLSILVTLDYGKIVRNSLFVLNVLKVIWKKKKKIKINQVSMEKCEKQFFILFQALNYVVKHPFIISHSCHVYFIN